MYVNSLGLAKPENKTRVCVAMSGGVDSSAAAYLLKKQGYDVFGLTMDLLAPPYLPQTSSISDAEVVARQLGIEHHFLDLRKEFAKKVIDYFASSYLKGLTPSPCIMCNKHIKLGILAEKAKTLGADIIVTGHYADIRMTTNGVELHRAKDLIKDQSYFLFAVDKHTLQMLRCPLAGMSKDETREIAKEAGLSVYKKSDSQDICFVSEGKYAELIRNINGKNIDLPGEIVNTDGKILGTHKGIINYTVGQRRGLGIGGGDILYVLKIDADNNRVIVGKKEELVKQKLTIDQINWLGEERPQEIKLNVKLRSRQEAVPASVCFTGEKTAEVTLDDGFYGIAPGQGCCFYDDTRVLGGGFICK